MTQHTHRTFVDGCYRCDLSRDEVEVNERVTLAKLEGIIARARGELWAMYVNDGTSNSIYNLGDIIKILDGGDPDDERR